MKENWTYRDLIDLEYFLSIDKDCRQTELHGRDREIYLDGEEDLETGSRECLIRHWLACRRKQLFDRNATKSPGRIAVESYHSTAYLLAAFAVILGVIAGLSFLAYSGTTPVNVLNFLFIFIFSQLVALVVIFPVAGLRIAGFSGVPAPVVSLYAAISNRFSRHITGITRLSAAIPAENRTAYQEIAGIWKKRKARYRQAAYWPLFSLSQYTMSGFNLGLLTATVYRLLTSDIAFGWQSTIQFSVQFIHKTVAILALPWSWIIPAQYAYPSEAEIEGSRIILKDGIYHLATRDLVSWWPFLVLCIIVYGLLLRSILLLIGRIGRRQSLRKLQFNTPALIQLLQRMQSPLITSQADAAVDEYRLNGKPEASGPDESKAHAACHAILLIPEEMSELCDSSAIKSRIERSGFIVSRHKIFMSGYGADQNLISELSSLDWPPDTGIAAVMESWMPPINETLLFFKELRAAIGPAVPIWVVLAGQTENESDLTQPLAADRVVWQRKIEELADPYLDLIEL